MGDLILSGCKNRGVFTQLLNPALIASNFSEFVLILSDLTQHTSLKLRLLLSEVCRRCLTTAVILAKMLEELLSKVSRWTDYLGHFVILSSKRSV